jgi:hypothetical protein
LGVVKFGGQGVGARVVGGRVVGAAVGCAGQILPTSKYPGLAPTEYRATSMRVHEVVAA